MSITLPLLLVTLSLAGPAAARQAAPSGVELCVGLATQEVESGAGVDLLVELDNGSSSLLEGVTIQLELRDKSGASQLALFQVEAPALVGIGAVDGSALASNLAPGGAASASFRITPSAAAAVGGLETDYTLTGSLSATLEGSLLVRQLPGQLLRVVPAPELELELLLPTNAHADWSATPGLFEDQEPFTVGVVVRNTGAAVASDLSLVSPGPLFLPDAQAAPLFAQVLEVQVDGVSSAGGFSLAACQLGDLLPGAERRILYTLGANYEAQLAGMPLSLFAGGVLRTPASTSEESLVHAALAFETQGGPLDDGAVDWLVDEAGVAAPIDSLTGTNFTEFPSVIRSSEGSSLALSSHVSPAQGAPPSASNLVTTVTINSGAPGWHYLRFDDPGGFLFELVQVTRTQKALQLGGLEVGQPGDVSRVWTTARPLDLTSDGLPDLVRREVHIVDFVPTAGTWEYSLAYAESGAASLAADVELLSAASGGTQQLLFDAGVAHAGETYVLLGSLAGTQPGVAVGFAQLPLNVDAYFLSTLLDPGLQALLGSVGQLDSQGRASAQVPIPPGFQVGTGLVAHHAFVTLPASGPIDFASNAVVLFVLP